MEMEEEEQEAKSREDEQEGQYDPFKRDWISRCVYGLKDFRVESSEKDEQDEDPDSVAEGRGPGDCVTLKGRLNDTHELFGLVPKYASYADISCLREYPNVAICGLTIKSPLYEYAIGCVNAKKRIASCYDKYVCKSVQLQPLPCKMAELSYVCKNLLDLSDVKFHAFLKNGPWVKDESYKSDSFNYTFTLAEVLKGLEKFSAQLERFVHSPECKRYFYFEKVQFVSKYYPEKYAIRVHWSKFDKLIETIKTSPHLLCFKRTIQIYWIPESQGYLSKKNKDGTPRMPKLPELHYSALQKIAYEHRITCKMAPWEKMTVELYDELKKDYNDKKHAYVEEWVLRTKLASEREAYDRALAWLKRMQLIVIEEDSRVYLWESFKYEMCIAQSLKKILENRLFKDVWAAEMNGDEETTEERWNPELVEEAKEGLCSEQTKAFLHHLVHPISMIAGKGGSGKSRFLESVMKLYSPEETVVTAFQGQNVGDLSRTLPGSCFTSHSLLFCHDLSCHNSPYRLSVQSLFQTSEQRKSGRKLKPGELVSSIGKVYEDCIFEKVRFLIVDELSLMYPELLARLLAATVTCGRLEAVVFTGDVNQMQSLRPGNLIHDIYEAGKTLGFSIEFFHNHRAQDEAAEILDHNAECIKRGDADGIRFDGVIAKHVEFSCRASSSKWKPATEAEDSGIARCITSILKENALDEYKHHIITRTNKIKNDINYAVEEYYGGKRTYAYQVGRKILFKKNEPERFINNEILILTGIQDVHEHQSALVLKRESTSDSLKKGFDRYLFVKRLDGDESDERTIQFDAIAKKWIRKGSASTIHSFQGRQTEIIVYVLPYASQFEYRESVYTAFTRATKGLVLVGSLEALKKAIQNPEPKRISTLHEKIVLACKQLAQEFAKADETEVQEIETKELEKKKKRTRDRELELEHQREEKKIRKPPSIELICGIPDEIWLYVFKMLADPTDLSHLFYAMGVCRTWNRICKDDEIWAHVAWLFYAGMELDDPQLNLSRYEYVRMHCADWKIWKCRNKICNAKFIENGMLMGHCEQTLIDFNGALSNLIEDLDKKIDGTTYTLESVFVRCKQCGVGYNIEVDFCLMSFLKATSKKSKNVATVNFTQIRFKKLAPYIDITPLVRKGVVSHNLKEICFKQ